MGTDNQTQNRGDLDGVATRLRLAREHAGLTQQEFADELGYSKRQVHCWETGANVPPIWVLAAVRSTYNVDPEWILSGPGLVPLQDARVPDPDRMPRLRREVVKLANQAGMNLPDVSIESMARVIAHQAPEMEREAKQNVLKVLRAISLAKPTF